MTDNNQTLACVMIPMIGRQLLLPNVSLAEVVDYSPDIDRKSTRLNSSHR